jgi:hypothetical protein
MRRRRSAGKVKNRTPVKPQKPLKSPIADDKTRASRARIREGRKRKPFSPSPNRQPKKRVKTPAPSKAPSSAPPQLSSAREKVEL